MTKTEFLDVINHIDDDLIQEYFSSGHIGEGEAVQPVYVQQKTLPVWKRIIPTIAAICAVLAVVIGGTRLIDLNLKENAAPNSENAGTTVNLSENTGTTVDLSENADTVVNIEVEKANKTAETAHRLFIDFLGRLDHDFCDLNENVVYEEILTVENGTWRCVGTFPWTEKEKLCQFFADSSDFSGMQNGYFGFVITVANVSACYVEDLEELMNGDYQMFDPHDYGGKFPLEYKWSGGEAGVIQDKNSDKTIIVGTYPVVQMGDEGILHEEETAHTYAYKNAKSLYTTFNEFLEETEKNGIEINDVDVPLEITVKISYGRYSVLVDDDLMDKEEEGKLTFRLIHALEDEYNYSSGWIKAYIVNGECRGIVFASNDLSDNQIYPSYEDFQKGSYHWDSKEDIGFVNGVDIGVYPELSYSEN